MKKWMMMCAFLGAFAFAASAQACHGDASKAGAAGKPACCAKPGAGVSDAASKAAAADPSIEKRVNAESGAVSYVRKVSNNGAVSFADVRFDDAVGKFVNLTPEEAAKCAAGQKPACCAGKANAASCSKGASGEAAAPATKSDEKPKTIKAVKVASADQK